MNIKHKNIKYIFLKNIVQFKIGKSIKNLSKLKKSGELERGKYKIISSSIKPLGMWNDFNQNGNSITITKDGVNAGFIDWQKFPFWSTEHGLTLINKNNDFDMKFLFYFLKNKEKEIQFNKINSPIPYIKISYLEKIKIPVLSLELQQFIAEVLDKFSELTAELTAELQLRKEQYEYYLNNIFNFNDVEYKNFKDVVVVKRGKRITKKDLIVNGKYPVISGGQNTFGYYDKFNRDENTITIAQYGTAGFVNWQKEKFWANDVCYSLYPAEELNNRFLYHYLLSIQDFIYSIVNKDAIPYHLKQEELEKVKIPIPLLEKQNQIVKILDTFSTLINDLEQGIPAEIKLRQQQYEYYRNLLLTFKEDENDKRA